MSLLSKRDQPMGDGRWSPVESKKARFVAEQPFGAPPPPIVPRVVLNPADCDLGDAISTLKMTVYMDGIFMRRDLHIVGLVPGLTWEYSVGSIVLNDTPCDLQNLCRIGISLGNDAVGSPEETRSSFGFGGTGSYLDKFVVGDTVICCVDLDSKPALIYFAKNGLWSSIIKQFDAGPHGLWVVDCPLKTPTHKLALFPHIWLKNVAVQMQFSAQDGLVPPEGYKSWSYAIEDGKGLLGPHFQNVGDCELIMMVGLPASVKSTWAENWVKAHPEKRYVLIGTDLALDKMKVPGVLCENIYNERFEWLMDCASKIFNTLLSRASKMPRNFIIDDSNVDVDSRKRRLEPFANHIKIAVVVFPKLEALKEHVEKRFPMGKKVSVEALKKMLVNFTWPLKKDMRYTDEYFDKVLFTELNRTESEICLRQTRRGPNLYREIYRKTGKGSLQTQDDSMSINYTVASMPTSGGPQHFYQESRDVTSIPSYDGSPHDQSTESLSGFGGWPDSYSIQTQSQVPSREYGAYAGHLQYKGNNAERRLAVPGSMNEQHRGYRPGVTFTSTDKDTHMNEAFGNTNPAPSHRQYPYVSQPQDPLSEGPNPRPPFRNVYPDDVEWKGSGRGYRPG